MAGAARHALAARAPRCGARLRRGERCAARALDGSWPLGEAACGAQDVSEREVLIEDFLARHGWAGAERRPLAGDASFRRYERLNNAAGATIVLMDAPPPHEDVRPYL